MFLCDVSLTCPDGSVELAKVRNETGSKTRAGGNLSAHLVHQWDQENPVSDPGRRTVEAMKRKKTYERESNANLRGSWRITEAILWPLALLKIEASPETSGRMPMTLSLAFREEFLSKKCLKSRVNDLILMRGHMIYCLRV